MEQSEEVRELRKLIDGWLKGMDFPIAGHDIIVDDINSMRKTGDMYIEVSPSYHEVRFGSNTSWNFVDFGSYFVLEDRCVIEIDEEFLDWIETRNEYIQMVKQL